QAQLPIAPKGAELLLRRGRRAVAAAGRRLARVAAGDRGAVEGGVELVLVELEPAAESPAGAAAPRQPFHALDLPGRLAEHVRALSRVRLHDRQRLERVARLRARPADAVVALERSRRAIARVPARHAWTTTNQFPAKTVRPPPSSAASSSGSK